MENVIARLRELETRSGLTRDGNFREIKEILDADESKGYEVYEISTQYNRDEYGEWSGVLVVRVRQAGSEEVYFELQIGHGEIAKAGECGFPYTFREVFPKGELKDRPSAGRNSRKKKRGKSTIEVIDRWGKAINTF